LILDWDRNCHQANNPALIRVNLAVLGAIRAMILTKERWKMERTAHVLLAAGILLKKTAIHVQSEFSKKGPQPMAALENRIPPPLVFLLVGAAMWAAARGMPAIQFDNTWRFGIVGAFLTLAAIVVIPAIIGFKRAKTTINPVNIEAVSTLVTAGIYRYTRNPMYVGLTAVLLAFSVYLAVPAAFLGPLAFVVFITRFQIIPEERVLRSKFGKAYSDYQQAVRRWL
jgi:protein-S-isoprenylcysteine O-methyltransferase Ste14